ncbi:hypothetical protein FACS189450_04300 [Spirochaetia bacterium]|nr:hypothetical protein FACS189450_04300 [Spirochaetia bacterium]
MPDREKELLNCFRQLPQEDQADVLAHVRTARIAENSARKTLAQTLSVDGGSGMEHGREKTAQG